MIVLRIAMYLLSGHSFCILAHVTAPWVRLRYSTWVEPLHVELAVSYHDGVCEKPCRRRRHSRCGQQASRMYILRYCVGWTALHVGYNWATTIRSTHIFFSICDYQLQRSCLSGFIRSICRRITSRSTCWSFH